MAEFKIVISDPKTGKSYQREVKEPDSRKLFGQKIGDHVKGEIFGLTGYEFEITGGSDYCGFPMRRDVIGTARKKILSIKGTGVQGLDSGERVRKTVAGNTVFENTSQVNLKVLKAGREPLEPKKEEAAKEEPAAKQEAEPKKEPGTKREAAAEKPASEEKAGKEKAAEGKAVEEKKEKAGEGKAKEEKKE
jgi:small subunit ribosomal protein S6e